MLAECFRVEQFPSVISLLLQIHRNTNVFSWSKGKVSIYVLYTGCWDLGDQNKTIVLTTLTQVCVDYSLFNLTKVDVETLLMVQLSLIWFKMSPTKHKDIMITDDNCVLSVVKFICNFYPHILNSQSIV